MRWNPALAWRDARGGMAVLGAVCAAALAVASGAAVDYGRVSLQASELQALVDGAALNAALRVRDGQADPDALALAARAEIAALSRRPPAPGQLTVSAALAPSGAPPEVTITAIRGTPLLFAGVLGVSTVQVSRQASATAPAPVAPPPCLLLLDPTAAPAWTMDFTSRISATGCDIQVNSSASPAIRQSGLTTVAAPATRFRASASTVQGFTVAPEFSQPAVADPWAPAITWPAAGRPCDFTNWALSGVSTATLSPGVYCGGISLGLAAQAELQPGVYTLQTGGLTVIGSAQLRAPAGGVTFVLLDPAGRVVLDGAAIVQLTAPTSGAWRDIAVAVKPQGTLQMSSIGSAANVSLSGVFYAPTQLLFLGGAAQLGGSAPRRALVAARLATTGAGVLSLAGPAAAPGGAAAAAGGSRLTR